MRGMLPTMEKRCCARRRIGHLEAKMSEHKDDVPVTWTGLPPDPTIDGWHWLRVDGFGGCATMIVTEPVLWTAETQTWSGGRMFGDCVEEAPSTMASLCYPGRAEYVGPCVMPDAEERRAFKDADEISCDTHGIVTTWEELSAIQQLAVQEGIDASDDLPCLLEPERRQ